MKLNSLSLSIALVLSASVLVGCGGSSNNDNTNEQTTSTDQSNNNGSGSDGSASTTEPTWTAGVFSPSADFIHRCEAPRKGEDPYENKPYDDVQGTAMHEKMWLRSFTNETYLWYDEIEDKDPKHSDFDSDENLDTVAKYFRHLKTDAVTESGKPKDPYHYSESYDKFKKEAQSGLVSGYGVRWTSIPNTEEKRIIKIAFTQDNSPAEQAGLLRGDTITAINGADINTQVSSEVNKLVAGFEPQAGETHTFTFKRDGIEEPIEVSLTARDVESTPVQNAQVIAHANKKVGYVQFNQFMRTGQDPLIDAFNSFENKNIDELVLDLRYNGGGLVIMSAQLAYMIAGEERTRASEDNRAKKSADNDAKVFSRTIRNQKVEATSSKEDYYTFENLKINWDTQRYTDITLPSVNLDTVYILSSKGTCSASESLINGLRGVDVNVVLIGDQTCGKPYGFTPTPNCGEVYFTVQFKSANAKEFGDYADGFKPVADSEVVRSTIGLTDKVPGCRVSDDFAHQLGDVNEGLFAAALTHIETGACPTEKASAHNAATFISPNANSELRLAQPFHPMRDGLIDIKVKGKDGEK